MKKWVAMMLAVITCLSLCACGHKHEWTDATCTDPKTCAECGETEGDPLGHEWVNATCTEPKTCSRCGETQGEPLGHTVKSWKEDKESTCSEPGIKSGTCTVCGERIETEIPLLEHAPGEWEITVQPTASKEGTRVKKCTVCGAEIETEQFTLSEEELKSLYVSECQSISYDELARYPDKYKDTKVKFSGTVVQVCSEASSPLYYSSYRVATSGRYDNVVYIKIDNYGAERRILEDDYITFYGSYDGIYSYKTVLGATMSIPSITVEYVE